ncbi:MAG: hypothetical protein WD342_01920 [Verrucomicrobiales bacterium]
MDFLRHFLAPSLVFVALQVGSGAEREIGTYTVEELRSRETTAALYEETRKRIAGLEKDLAEAKTEGDEDEQEDLEEELELLEFSGNWLRRALAPGAAEREIYDANAHVERFLHTLEEGLGPSGLWSLPKLFRNVFLGGLVGQPAPNVPAARRDQPLGEARAEKEAVNLHASGRKAYFSVGELAAMTPEEVAALDVSPEHPVWYDRRTLAGMADPVEHLESRLRRGMTAVLRKEGDLDAGADYPMHAARRVLFLEEIYLSGTSAKGTAEDAFGVEWKVKWGDEVAVEPVAGRLYLLAGGKATDFVYTSGHGPDDMVLVLMDPEEAEEERKDDDEDELYPVTVEELKSDLDEFYGFDVEPYIAARGVVTPSNVDSILRNHPGAGKSKYRKEKMIGRHWVAFRESSVEFKPQGYIERHDGSRMSDPAAIHDRAFRGMYLFDLWIANRDVKDDNNKAFFFRSPGEGMEISEYREGHHDIGHALGSVWSSGEVNKFRPGETFVRRGLFGNLRFPQATLFRPGAWEAATWADLKWMAGNIVRISDSEIEEAVSASGWPDFVRAAVIYKLVSRRDRIAELFGIDGGSDRASVAAPTMSLPLGTPEEIEAVERRYRLAPGSLARALGGRRTRPGYSETVLRDGKIADCRRSAVVRELVRQRYPSGLDTRYSRLTKTKPRCLEPE